MFERIKNFLGFGKKKESKRSYAGGKVSRLTADWVLHPTSGNRELRQSLRILRARSRDLMRNDPYIKKFLAMCKTNIIGRGIQLQVRAKDGDEIDRIMEKIVERAWATWGHKENCSASRKLSWLDAQNLFVETWKRDGEVLVQMVYADNPFEFALKFISVDWLDETYTETRTNGNRVIMSVEVDPDDRVVAYWLTPPASDFPADRRAEKIKYRTRVDASEFIHAFSHSEDEAQVRGIPRAHAVMSTIKMLNGYTEAELVAARVEASKMLFLVPPASDLSGDIDEETNRTFYEDEVAPGQMMELPPGYTTQSFDPKHPNENHPEFVKARVREIASGCGVSHFSLANDLTDVNYSSARIGLLEERDNWRVDQDFVVEHFCRPIYQAWLKAAMISGAVTIRMSDYEKIKEPFFRARGWTWVDPQKETSANVEQINNTLTTHTDVLAEQGLDLEDVLETKRREKELAARYGVELSAESAKSNTTQPMNE